MTVATTRKGRGRWPRSVAAVALLALGAACGGTGHASSSAVRGTSAERAAETPAPEERQQVVPRPVGASQGPDTVSARGVGQGAPSVPPPPAPDLGTQRPETPPNTVTLDSLFQQGRTHVLR